MGGTPSVPSRGPTRRGVESLGVSASMVVAGISLVLLLSAVPLSSAARSSASTARDGVALAASASERPGSLATPGPWLPLVPGPVSLSLNTSNSSVCAFGFSTCSGVGSTVRVTLRATAPAEVASNSAQVQVLYLIDVSPFMASCRASTPCA
jgi:hypothetical protein